MLDLTRPEGRSAANEKAARLIGVPAFPVWECGCGASGPEPSGGIQIDCPMCGLPVAHRPAPDFLSGLRPDGTCDESKVNGDLLWRVLLACRGDCYIVSLHVHWNGEGWDSFAMGRSYHHAHPVAALLLAAGHARLLDKGEGK